jgi:hypothetical protein
MGNTGNFFVIDRRIFAEVCRFGENAAAAYLVIACGSDSANRYSQWSIQAIEKYTGISRSRARTAVKTLEQSGLVIPGDIHVRPRYELPTWAEFAARKRLGFDSQDQQQADHLVWLPKTLVTGAAGETSAVERVRQTRDPMTFRLLVDLYSVHELNEEMGIKRSVLWQEYERTRVGRWAEFDIWGFRPKVSITVRNGEISLPHYRTTLTREEKQRGENRATDFFRRLSDLQDIGLVEWVPCLFDGDREVGEPLFPYHFESSYEPERRLARAVYDASYAMLTENQRTWAKEEGYSRFTALFRHTRGVQMFGICRLRHQPNTTKTGKWWRDLNVEGEKLIAEYTAIAERVAARRKAVA